jgi:hypothetical protein
MTLVFLEMSPIVASLMCGACYKSTEDVAINTCSQCMMARYCSIACQRSHWPEHKAECRVAKEVAEKRKELSVEILEWPRANIFSMQNCAATRNVPLSGSVCFTWHKDTPYGTLARSNMLSQFAYFKVADVAAPSSQQVFEHIGNAAGYNGKVSCVHTRTEIAENQFIPLDTKAEIERLFSLYPENHCAWLCHTAERTWELRFGKLLDKQT